MKRPMDEVMLCCNNHENGYFTGFLDAIEVGGRNGDTPLLYITASVRLRIRIDQWERFLKIRLGKNKWRRIRCLTYQHWVGNWCWDMVRLDRLETKRLLRMCAQSGWDKEEWTKKIGKWFDKQKRRTVK